MLQEHSVGQHMCLVGERGVGKSALGACEFRLMATRVITGAAPACQLASLRTALGMRLKCWLHIRT